MKTTPLHLISLSLVMGVLGCSKSGDKGGAPEAPPSVVSKDAPPKDDPNANLDALEPDKTSRPSNPLCAPARSAARLPGVREDDNPRVATLQASELRAALKTACAGCHGAPAAKAGGFSFHDSHAGAELPYNGAVAFYPGVRDKAEQMRDAIVSGRMPPAPLRDADPKGFQKLGERLDAWIAAGKPEGSFPLPDDPATTGVVGAAGAATDLGDCIPKPEAVGVDPGMDAAFAAMESLPEALSETDLSTLDAFALAQKGTVSYNVEYPLWADNAEKGRYVHVPAKRLPDGTFARQAIRYDAARKSFDIPENTRFYKTFYKAVKRADGKTVFRKIETRIIVTRQAPRTPLFGSYRWDASETRATLHAETYRDGTPFKDLTFDVVVDEATGTSRKYALPGAQRCVDCHTGGADKSFVLGFTPLQINRRAFGDAGRDLPVGEDELTQAERLLAYGVVSGYRAASELPVLESSGTAAPRNVHELRMQGYAVGNCAHCHTPDGIAMKDNDVPLNFTAGKLFDFNPKLQSKPPEKKYYVRPREADLMQSYVYYRVKASRKEQGLKAVMPMHTPGGANCRLVNLVGRWIKAFEDVDAADAHVEECAPQDDFDWIEQDFTWPKSDVYVPRRADWNDPRNGMPESYRALRLDDTLRRLVNTSIPVGWWDAKEECRFPDAPLPGEAWKAPWMFTGNQIGNAPKKPLGQVYAVKPGAWFYTTTCQKCHGPKGDGNSALANGLLQWSGGSVRVANFVDGLFGGRGANLATFDVDASGETREGVLFGAPTGKPIGKKPPPRKGGGGGGDGGGAGLTNLAGNYLIWMAMEGTKVNFPPEAEPFVGKHKAQMLNQVREKCIAHIPSARQVAKPYFEDYAVFHELCFHENGAPTDPQIQFDPESGEPVNPAALAAWADKAAINAGWAIYEYLKNDATQEGFAPSKTECEKVYSR